MGQNYSYLFGSPKSQYNLESLVEDAKFEGFFGIEKDDNSDRCLSFDRFFRQPNIEKYG